MLGQSQKKHQFDVCGRVYYCDGKHAGKEGELAVETVEASSHEEAEAMFKNIQAGYAREFKQIIDRIEITFTLDLTIAESDSDEAYLVV